MLCVRTNVIWNTWQKIASFPQEKIMIYINNSTIWFHGSKCEQEGGVKFLNVQKQHFFALTPFLQ